MSVTSMNSRMAMAEKLSIPQLQQAIKAGTVPAYVGIPLLQEKVKLQKSMQAQMGQQEQPEGTVAEQVMREAEMEGGIDQLPSNLPVYGEEEMGGGMPEYARGGIVALAEGGEAEDDYVYGMEGASAAPVTTTVSSGQPSLTAKLPTAEISPETQALFKEYGDQIRAQRAGSGKDREEALYMSLIQGGLAAAGGVSPNALQNIAQGATVGFQNFQKSMQDIKKEDRAALKQLLDMGLTKEKFLQEAQKMGVDVYKADKAFDASKYSTDMSYAASMARTGAEKRAPAITSAEIDAAEIERGANVLRQKNPDLSADEARSQAYQNLLKIKHPDPSNLANISGILGARTTAVNSDPAVVAAGKELNIASAGQDAKAIEVAKARLKAAQDAAADKFDANLANAMAQSNRGGAPAGAQTPTGAAPTTQAPPVQGAAPAPKLPRGATPNQDGTFNFPGNAKVPAGVYKSNPDGSIVRVR